MDQAYKNKAILFDIRGRLLMGIITYDQAVEEAMPVIDELNTKGKEIALRQKKRFVPFTFAGFMR